jgi:hypothetical protein
MDSRCASTPSKLSYPMRPSACVRLIDRSCSEINSKMPPDSMLSRLLQHSLATKKIVFRPFEGGRTLGLAMKCLNCFQPFRRREPRRTQMLKIRSDTLEKLVCTRIEAIGCANLGLGEIVTHGDSGSTDRGTPVVVRFDRRRVLE